MSRVLCCTLFFAGVAASNAAFADSPDLSCSSKGTQDALAGIIIDQIILKEIPDDVAAKIKFLADSTTSARRMTAPSINMFAKPQLQFMPPTMGRYTSPMRNMRQRSAAGQIFC